MKTGLFDLVFKNKKSALEHRSQQAQFFKVMMERDKTLSFTGFPLPVIPRIM